MGYKNVEGCSNSVLGKAMANINKKMTNSRPVVYVCSPFSGDVVMNTLKARKYCRFTVDQGAIPIAPHLLFPQFIKEETERELALQMDMVLLAHCLELWVFGSHISEGMAAEIARARQKCMPIKYFSEDLEEVAECNL